MARMDSLYCPFPPKIHPSASSIHEGAVLWARSLGMLPTEQHIRTAQKSKAGWLAARAFPTASPRGLQLMADWTMLLCVLDDHIEKRGTADEVAAYLQRLLGLFRADLVDPAGDPIASGIIDLRHRLQDLAVPGHFQRFTERMEELFAGYVAEARNRDRTQIPDVASYMRLREVTIGLKVMVSLAEFLEGASLPDHLRDHPALQKLTTRASNIVGWANDLFTYEKEIIQGEIHNLVLVLMNERRLTITEAVAEAVALHDNEVRSFLGEVEQLPLLGVADAGAERYVETLRCWIRGHLDWASETGRYRPFDPRAGGHTRQSANRSVAA